MARSLADAMLALQAHANFSSGGYMLLISCAPGRMPFVPGLCAVLYASIRRAFLGLLRSKSFQSIHPPAVLFFISCTKHGV